MFLQLNRKRKPQSGRQRPALEALEDRCLLSYSVTDLGTLGGNESYAYGVNLSGQVAGTSQLTSSAYPNHAFLTSPNSPINPATDSLGALDGGSWSDAYAVNDSGEVVGYSDLGPMGGYHAFLYSGGTMTDLGSLRSIAGAAGSIAYAINASGQAVGRAQTNDSSTHAFRTSPDSPINPATDDLGTLPGARDSEAHGINASGQVVGWSDVGGPYGYHAFFWDAATGMQDLGLLPGSDGSQAYAINDSGQVVGSAWVAVEQSPHAFIWDSSNGMQDLGPGELHAINNAGQAVGIRGSRGILYDGSTLIDLNTQVTGCYVYSATAINDAGQIAAIGTPNGQSGYHALLLTPDGGGGSGTGGPAQNASPAAPISIPEAALSRSQEAANPVAVTASGTDLPAIPVPVPPVSDHAASTSILEATLSRPREAAYVVAVTPLATDQQARPVTVPSVPDHPVEQVPRLEAGTVSLAAVAKRHVTDAFFAAQAHENPARASLGGVGDWDLDLLAANAF